jgi:FlaA1/EpsC-like NDP-sugar epimerase
MDKQHQNNEERRAGGFRGSLRRVVGRILREEGGLTRLVRNHRLLFTLLFFGLLSAISVTISFFLRFVILENVLDTSILNWHMWWLAMLAVTVPVRLVFFWAAGIHRTPWRFASLEDLPPLVLSVLSSSALIIIALWVFWTGEGGFPLSSLAIDMVLCLTLVTIGRFSYRLIGGPSDRLGNRAPRQRAIIVGAGNAGNLTIEAMQSPRLGGFKPVAIVDDNPKVRGMKIRGVPILGTIDDMAKVAADRQAEVIVLAVPSASTSEMYRIVQRSQESGLPMKSVPSFWEIMESDKPRIRRVEDFSTDSLLKRRPVAGDLGVLTELLAGKRVLVTGAAGSIGSELCRQINECGAAYLACLDKDENGLFRVERELRDAPGGTQFDFLLGDIKNKTRLEAFFDQAKPDIVFHAAAYKHVPILQFHPEEAVSNNVFGTRQLVDMAVRFKVARFVMISTDKAVNPTNVMGSTKQVAEKVVLSESVSERDGPQFSIIRFGNVLGSAGSVVEMFHKQISRGGPVTVTHPEMVRFFMTIAEAVQLVLFAAALGKGGEVFILDMGDQVKIDELARQMIRLSGLTPDVDVQIEYIGLRPGEKLYEELWAEGEEPCKTDNPDILVARRQAIDPVAVEAGVGRLVVAASSGDREALWRELLALVPDFQGHTGTEAEIPPEIPPAAPRATEIGES